MVDPTPKSHPIQIKPEMGKTGDMFSFKKARDICNNINMASG